MFDWFIAIPGTSFLGYFWVFSIFAILISRGLISADDDSEKFEMPSIKQLKLYQIAALREGRKGIIHTALFNLWQKNLIHISGKNQDAEIRINSDKDIHIEEPFEQIIYCYLAEQPRKPANFFDNSSLHNKIDVELHEIDRKLEEYHLRLSGEQMAVIENRNKKIRNFCLLSIAGLGGLKLTFGILRNKPIIFLVISLIFLLLIGGILLSPSLSVRSRLGDSYLKTLKDHFEWMKTEERSGFDPALRVAILGIAGLAGLVIFNEFQEAFAASETASSSSSGGGCGGGCGGGGGGCGGCGGGGD